MITVMRNFKIIAITPEEISSNEPEAVSMMLESGKVDRVHIRHKSATPEKLSNLLKSFPPEQCARISIHLPCPGPGSHGLDNSLFQFIKERNFGLHLPSTATPDDIRFARSSGIRSVSVSCHSFDEIKAKKNDADYCFLSPIFDSISKLGYLSAFTPEVLAQASDLGLIDSKVIALGGIEPDKISFLKELGFGGAAMLGFFSDRSEGLSHLRHNLSLF